MSPNDLRAPLCLVGLFNWETNLRRDMQRIGEALADLGCEVGYVEPPVRLDSAPPLVRSAKGDQRINLIKPRALPGRRWTPLARLSRIPEVVSLRRAWRLAFRSVPGAVIVHSPSPRSFMWRAFPGALKVSRNYDYVGSASEASAYRQAEVVFTSSPRYADTQEFAPGRTVFLPNACDDFTDVWRTRMQRQVEGRPAVVGTLGTFSFTTDYRLLERCVRSHRSVFFLFQGLFDPGVEQRLRAPNVTIITAQTSDPGLLTKALEAIDVGLLRYRLTEWTKHAFPGRLLAFLSAGIPVVTTNFSRDTLFLFSNLRGVLVARSPEHFSDLVTKAAQLSRDPQVTRELIEATMPYRADKALGGCSKPSSEPLISPRRFRPLTMILLGTKKQSKAHDRR